MHVAAKRSIVAAAAVAAAGLFGSLSYDSTMVAQSGVPTVHHDVALVDVTSSAGSDLTELAAATGPTMAQTTFLTAENLFNDQGYSAFFGSFASSTATERTGGFEDTLYNALGGAGSSSAPSNAALFLDTYGQSGALPANYATTLTDGGPTEIFNGATTQYLDGVYADGLLGEDYLNQALGISAANSEASIIAQLGNDPFVNLGSGLTDPTAAQEGTSAFDGALVSIAQGSFTNSFNDLTGYFTYLQDNSATLEAANFSLTTLLGDVTSGLNTSVMSLSTDFTTFITAIETLASSGL